MVKLGDKFLNWLYFNLRVNKDNVECWLNLRIIGLCLEILILFCEKCVKRMEI